MKSNAHDSGSSRFSSLRGKVSVGVLTALALAGSVRSALADPMLAFQNVINTNDPTFNQELGINNSGMIAGYFGSGIAPHPNQGYTLVAPYGQANFTNENFPGSVQTQVTGLNNIGTTVGFWSNTVTMPGMDSNFGFVDIGGVFTNVNNPGTATTPPVFNQLLGVNDSNIAVGFYMNAAGNTFGYTYNIATGTFSPNISDPSGVPGTTTTAAINNSGELAGFYTNASTGTVEGFIDNGGLFTTLDVPGSMSTSLLGLNNEGEAVGFDVDAMGNMHGVICNVNTLACVQQDDPNGIGTTTFNGVNDAGQIVGFYVNPTTGFTIGLLATPVPEPSSLALFLSAMAAVGAISFWRRRRA
jgi:PEP-CTERM motif